MSDANQKDQNRRNYNLDNAADMWGFQQAQAWTNYAQAQEAQYISILNEEQSINHREQSAMIGWQDKENMRLYSYGLEARAYEESIKGYDRQLGFNDIAHKIALNDTARSYEDQLTSLGFQDRDLLLKYYEGGQTAAYETKGLTQKIEQAEAMSKLQVRGVKLNKEFAESEAALKKAGLRQDLDAKYADAAFKIQGLRTEYVDKEGKQRVLGQAGRSASKAIQALLATHGSTQAALVDSITRADAREQLNFREISQNLLNVSKKSNLKYAEIAENLTQTVNRAEYAQEGVGLKFEQLGRRTEFAREQVQASRDSAGRQYMADRQKVHLDKYNADLQAYSNVRLKPIAPPQAGLPLQLPNAVRQKISKPQAGPKPKMEPDMVDGRNILGSLAQTAVGVGLMLVPGTGAAAKAAQGLGKGLAVGGAGDFIQGAF